MCIYAYYINSNIDAYKINYSQFQVYQGYSDDPRNTDNAWLETRAINYHDEEGTILRNLQLKVSTTAY